jgi:putative ABC transport system permease protein
MRRDLQHAGRALVRSPGYALAVILTLALGIGGTTAVTSVLRSVLLEPLPYAPNNRVMALAERDSLGTLRALSYPTFQDWHTATRSFEHLAFVRGLGSVLRTELGAERVTAAFVTEDFFGALPGRAHLGRTLRPDEFQPGAPSAVVLTYRLWQRRFGGDPDAIGRTIRLDQSTPVVVGVMTADFGYPPWAELLAPISMIAADPALTQRGLHADSRVVGRLRIGADSAAAARELSAIAARVAQAYPAESGGYRAAALEPVSVEVIGTVGPQLRLLTIAAVLVLMIASVNIANLSLARANVRSRELALRTALGAGRGALLRLLAAESVLLGLAGAGLGLLGAVWCTDALRAAGQSVLPRVAEVTVDWRVLVAAATVSVALVVILGLLPVVWSASGDLVSRLKESAAGATGPQRRRIRSWLVIAEFALALVLLVGSGLLVRSLLNLQRVDPGFDVDRLLAVPIAPPSPRYDDPSRALALYRAALDAVAAEPGVEAAALTNHVPLTGSGILTRLETDGPPRGKGPPEVLYRVVNEDYFTTAGIPLLQGRGFSAEDVASPGDAVLVNQALARRWWPDGSAIGRRVTVFKSAQGRPDFGEPVPGTVVGVVGDVRHYGVEIEPVPEIYLPYTVSVWPRMALLVRVRGDAGVTRQLTSVLSRLEPDLPLVGAGFPGGIQPVDEILGEGLAYRRLIAGLLGAFAVPALLLAGLGIYAITAYLVTQRTGEIAIRLALGSTPGAVLGLMLRQGVRLAAIGVALGFAAAVALTRLIRAELFDVSPTDPLTLLSAGVVLVAIGAIATFLPARRATGISPMQALRSE